MDYRDFFSQWYDGCVPTSYARLARVRETEDGSGDIGFTEKFFRVDDVDGMAAFVEQYRDSCNLYLSACTFRSESSKKDNVWQIPRLWVDIDPDEDFTREQVEAEAAAIEDFSTKLDSGGGFQITWKLRSPVDVHEDTLDKLDTYLTQLCKRHHGDMGAKGANRVLRIPGTLNFPTQKKVQKGRSWDPVPVGEPDTQDRVFLPVDMGLRDAPDSQPQLITREETEAGVTRDSCQLNLKNKTWDLIEQGGGDLSAALWSVICSLIRKTTDDQLIADIILHPNHKVGEHRRDRVRQLQQEIAKARTQNPFANVPDADERTAAKLFLDRYGDTIRAVPAHEKHARWMIYDEELGRWRPRRSVQDQIVPIADEFEQWGERYFEEANRDPENAQMLVARGNRMFKFANQLRTTRGSKAVEDYLIRSHAAGLVMLPTEFDADPDLIGVKNGVLSLSERKLVIAEPEQYVYRSLGAEWIDVSPSKYLDLFVEGLGSARGDIQQFFGYALEPGNPKQKLTIIVGDTATGKSTLTAAMRRVLGEYAISTSMGIFRNPTANTATPGLARIAGRRLAYVQEVEGGQLDNAALKRATGSDAVPARGLYADEFEVVPADTKLVLLGNDEPDVESIDEAIRRRLVVIQLDGDRHDGEGRIEDLAQKIEPEAMLRWLMDGMHRVRDSGFQWSSSTAVATTSYFAEQNTMVRVAEEFLLTDRFAPNGEPETVELQTVYAAYQLLMEATGETRKAMSYRQFTHAFKKENPDLVIRKIGHDNRVRINAALLNEDRVRYYKAQKGKQHFHQHFSTDHDTTDGVF